MNSTLDQQLSRLTILLACELDSEGIKLMRHLQRTRATVRHVWPAPTPLGGNADVVIVEYAKELASSVIWDPGEASAALIVLLPHGGQYDLKDLRKSLPDAVLYRPYHLPAIDVALMLALDHSSYVKRQRMRIARLDENIKAMRDIEEAKHLIMKRKSLSGNDAYRLMRELAMEKRVTVAEIAEKLVDSSDVLI